jgi:hypothetical protein
MNNKKNTIQVQGTAIVVLTQKEEDYISLTEILMVAAR